MGKRKWIWAGALLGASGVALGALGAHALRGNLTPNQLAGYQTAVRYQLLHALAILVVTLGIPLDPRWQQRCLTCFLLGTLAFSGSIYALLATHWRWLGPVTPLGGLLLIAGWLCLGRSASGAPE